MRIKTCLDPSIKPVRRKHWRFKLPDFNRRQHLQLSTMVQVRIASNGDDEYVDCTNSGTRDLIEKQGYVGWRIFFVSPLLSIRYHNSSKKLTHIRS